MRDSCLYCGMKHVTQAIVLLHESVQGYPDHKWLAIGHLAEASDELILEYPDLAHEIRAERLNIMEEDQYKDKLMNIIPKISRLINNTFPDPIDEEEEELAWQRFQASIQETENSSST